MQPDFEALADAVSAGLNRTCLDAGRPVGVAVSGGGDSVALLLLAADWARKMQRSLHVFTVDHGLRAASAGEAAFVARLACTLGVESTVLTLEGVRPSGAQARARRHVALAQAARARGCATLLLGHTHDDQVETCLIRLQQGSGWYGLGGVDSVAPSPAWPEGRGVTLMRPLLEVSRSCLRAFLSGRGQDWCEDPSNLDPRHERVRARQRLATDAWLTAQLVRMQARFSRLRRAEQRGLAHKIATQVECRPDGSLRADLSGMTPDRQRRLLSLLVQCGAGHAAPLRDAALADALAHLCEPGAAAVTLGGAWLVPGRRKGVEAGPVIAIYRDPGGVAGCEPLGDVWDGRFERTDDGSIPTSDARAQRSLPPQAAGWRALNGDRLASLCEIWNRK